jgi:hypothetical protein
LRALLRSYVCPIEAVELTYCKLAICAGKEVKSSFGQKHAALVSFELEFSSSETTIGIIAKFFKQPRDEQTLRSRSQFMNLISILKAQSLLLAGLF